MLESLRLLGLLIWSFLGEEKPVKRSKSVIEISKGKKLKTVDKWIEQQFESTMLRHRLGCCLLEQKQRLQGRQCLRAQRLLLL